MNNEILNKFLIEMGKTLEQTKDFAMEQMPLVAKEILVYKCYEHICNSCLIILAIILLSIIAVFGYKGMLKDDAKIGRAHV